MSNRVKRINRSKHPLIAPAPKRKPRKARRGVAITGAAPLVRWEAAGLTLADIQAGQRLVWAWAKGVRCKVIGKEVKGGIKPTGKVIISFRYFETIRGRQVEHVGRGVVMPGSLHREIAA